MLPQPELITGHPADLLWHHPAAVSAIDLQAGSVAPYTTAGGPDIGSYKRPMYNKLWQARFDSTPYRAIWVNPASDPDDKFKLLDTNMPDAVALSLTFSATMQPCVAWWNRAMRINLYWYCEATLRYIETECEGEYPVLVQEDAENVHYGHSHMLLFCLINGRLHYYASKDGFRKPTALLPGVLWHRLEKAAPAEGRRLGIVGERHVFA